MSLPAPFRCAIFDMDGTVLDSMPVWDTLGEDYLRSLGRDPGRLQIVAEIDQPDVILSAVAAGMGAAVCSQLAARQHLQDGRLLAFDLADGGVYRELYLICLRDAALSPLEQAFWRFAEAQCRF